MLVKRRFDIGDLVATPGALAIVDHLKIGELLARHVSGDWGDLGDDDKAENEFAIGKYLRIFSSYNTENGKVWIITEADRSSTCVLTPSEY